MSIRAKRRPIAALPAGRSLHYVHMEQYHISRFSTYDSINIQLKFMLNSLFSPGKLQHARRSSPTPESAKGGLDGGDQLPGTSRPPLLLPAATSTCHASICPPSRQTPRGSKLDSLPGTAALHRDVTANGGDAEDAWPAVSTDLCRCSLSHTVIHTPALYK